MKKGKFLQGKYIPANPSKYKGNLNNIQFRSSWELKMFRECDTDDKVISWSSEEHVVPYKDPFSSTRRRYFIDIYMKYRTSSGEVIERLIEIKPKKQTMLPKVQKRKTKRYLKEIATYYTNQAKWAAADKYAKDRNMEFKVFTETELGIH
jgi:hypothetical protein